MAHPTSRMANGTFIPDLSENLKYKLRESECILQEAFEKHGKHQIFLSFNGGKDCTVLLHLLSDLLKDAVKDLKVIYFRSGDPFPEIEEFVEFCVSYYGVKISSVQSDTSMKQVLTSICENDKHLRACVMGTRRSDPYCLDLKSFHPTDRGWPELMRINPMLDWNCENVWEYLLKKKVPYCSLYDIGYTSIGNMKNTRPNPNLEVKEKPGTFLPAYKLLDDSLERAGRFST